MNKIFTLFCGMLIFFSQGISAQTDSAKKAFERGMSAYNKERYSEAYADLKIAALGGVAEAFKPLIELCSDGDYDGSGIGNYQEAFSWNLMAMNKYLEEGANNKNLGVTCMMYYDPLCFLTGDYQETIDHVLYGYGKGTPRIPYVMNQVAASYLKLGNISEAIDWLDSALNMAVEKKDNISIHTAKALLSKIYLDKEDYSHALELSKEAASEGKVPLAAYVYGVSLIKTNNHPDIGKKWVKLAAEYDYNSIFEINCFEDEIQKYWRTIMNKSF
ncbi:MAG: tetratricopeptide repeat protein [Muribaculaceae bacterium]|nr:tetratricopeptide repeat protein [Muribaculaceae bacterium]